ncbi:U3 small nucleolar RNA-associated protein [Blastocladiella emersonii ATCC 22665]|nr:U3 small nucleolar RNA-associated protein [Blastocladiella emersonii ATCC 22665]
MESHVVRFVDHVPSAIGHMALTPDTARPMLAVARENGDIEIRLPANSWQVERVIVGGENRTVSSIAWAHQSVLTDPDFYDDDQERSFALKRQMSKRIRLFTSSLNGYITEWNIDTLQEIKSVDATGGGVWSLAVNPSGTLLAAGCEDGCIRLFDIADDEFVLLRTFNKQKGRVLCLAWHPSGDYVVSGSDASDLRQWDVKTGTPRDRATLDRVDRKHTVVWCVRVLGDGTIVSGNSLGRVEFWDWRTATLIQSVTAHEADVLALDVARDGKTVYSGSVDRGVVQIRLAGAKKHSQWTKAHMRRYHSNDVKAVCVVDRKGVHALVSGGIDAEVITVELANGGFTTSPQRRRDEFQVPRISAAPEKKWFLARFENTMRLYRLGGTGTSPAQLDKSRFLERLTVKDLPCVLAEIRLNAIRNIEHAVLSDDGAWIAASHADALKLWHVAAINDDDEVQVHRVKAKLPAMRHLSFAALKIDDVAGVQQRAAAAIFGGAASSGTDDNLLGGHLLAGVDGNNHVLVYHLPLAPASATAAPWRPRLVAKFEHHAPAHVVHVALSQSGRYLASSDATTRAYIVDLWSAAAADAVVADDSDLVAEALFEKKALPQYAPHSITSLSFTSPPTAGPAAAAAEYLVLTLSSNDFYLFTAPTFEQHRWTRTNLSRLGADFRERSDYFRGAYALPKSRLLLWTSNWFLVVDLARDLAPLAKRKAAADDEDAALRKAAPIPNAAKTNVDLVTNGYALLSRYQRLMHLEVLGPRAMMVVERPWADFVAALPEAFARKKYGM